MRVVLLALAAAALVAPSAAAQPPETLRHCSEVHCVVVRDTDGDGSYDWANAAFTPGALQALFGGVNYNRTVVSWYAAAGTEEAVHQIVPEALHEFLPEEAEHEFHMLTADGYADLTAPEGGWGYNDTAAWVGLVHGNEETGALEEVARVMVRLRDADRDGRPDELTYAAYPLLP